MSYPHIQIALISPPDREHLVAELSVGNDQIAEIVHNGLSRTIEAYPKRDGSPWLLSVDEFIGAIEGASTTLRGRLGF